MVSLAAVAVGACGDDGGANPAPAGAVEITVTADNFSFDPDEITVAAGDEVAIMLASVDILHDFTIDELDIEVVAKAADTTSAGFRATQPGRYTFYCAQPGHRAVGMEGTLVVEAPGES